MENTVVKETIINSLIDSWSNHLKGLIEESKKDQPNEEEIVYYATQLTNIKEALKVYSIDPLNY